MSSHLLWAEVPDVANPGDILRAYSFFGQLKNGIMMDLSRIEDITREAGNH